MELQLSQKQNPANIRYQKTPCRPFVKWAGGKTQLGPALVSNVPEFRKYYEPFVGGGALFFSLLPTRSCIADVNPELINCYKVVKWKVGSLIEELSKYKYNEDFFYKIREADRDASFYAWTDVERAARFIYLNKTCFNGLHRVNSKGEFNVPFGKYSNPTILDKSNLVACSKALSRTRIELSSFEKIVRQAEIGDFVYFDPPYVPLNNTSYFTSYTSDGFGPNEQTLLRDVCLDLNNRGVKFMLSNSYTDFVLELYSAFDVVTVKANRAINSKGSKRGPVKEVIVTNY